VHKETIIGSVPIRTKAPGLDWPLFLQLHSAKNQQDFVVWNPVVAGFRRCGSEPLATWKDYLALHAIERRAAYLQKRCRGAFRVLWHDIEGTPELRARWKRAIDATNDALGDAVGKLYASDTSRYAKSRIERWSNNCAARLIVGSTSLTGCP